MPRTVEVEVSCPHCKKVVAVTAEVEESDPKTDRMTKGLTINDNCPECGKPIRLSR